jgi:hypothetical protein
MAKLQLRRLSRSVPKNVHRSEKTEPDVNCHTGPARRSRAAGRERHNAKRQQMNGTTALHILEVVGLFGLLAVVTGGIVIATKRSQGNPNIGVMS